MESSVEKGVWDSQDIMKYFGKSSTTVWHWRKKVTCQNLPIKWVNAPIGIPRK